MSNAALPDETIQDIEYVQSLLSKIFAELMKAINHGFPAQVPDENKSTPRFLWFIDQVHEDIYDACQSLIEASSLSDESLSTVGVWLMDLWFFLGQARATILRGATRCSDSPELCLGHWHPSDTKHCDAMANSTLQNGYDMIQQVQISLEKVLVSQVVNGGYSPLVASLWLTHRDHI